MARVEGGDAFDYILQAWLQNGQQTNDFNQQQQSVLLNNHDGGSQHFTTASAFTSSPMPQGFVHPQSYPEWRMPSMEPVRPNSNHPSSSQHPLQVKTSQTSPYLHRLAWL